MSAIPAASRTTVRERETSRCCRCATPAPNGEWHHRRSRRVVDQHQHCPCNGVLLCNTCHRWAHQNPLMARLTGFIVSAYTATPGNQQIVTPWGTRLHGCDGSITYVEDEHDADEQQ